MRKALKIVCVLLCVVVLGAIAGLGYLRLAFPKVSAAPALAVKPSPELLARGRYLGQHVAVCASCHSERDWTRYAGPIRSGTEGEGGERFGEEMGLPGTLYARNITPAGIGNWSDGELLRAFTAGVTPDGRALFPIMPYPNYAHLSLEDASAIIVYLRSLKPVAHAVPPRELKFPMSFIVRTIPHDAAPGPRPAAADEVAYGRYLATAASCEECHTMQVHGQKLPGMKLAGGMAFPMPWGTLRSANITPDLETGIGSWSREQFVQRFKGFSDAAAARPVRQGEPNTIMPWLDYAGMTEQDLGAIYAYLRTAAPVRNPVPPFQLKGQAR